MGILNTASGNSVWRGYDYYKEGRVLSCEQIGETIFAGRVQGKNVYSVAINFLHIRKSSCDCAHAKSGRIVCKHMVAMYFAAFPEESKRFIPINERLGNEQEKYEERMESIVEDYIRKMPAAKVREELYRLLMDSPRPVFKKFVSEHSIEDSYENDVGYIGEKEFADLFFYPIGNEKSYVFFFFDVLRINFFSDFKPCVRYRTAVHKVLLRQIR